MIAYIAGPYRAKTDAEVHANIVSASKVGRYCRTRLQFTCIVPHLESMYHEDSMTEEEWLRHGLDLLRLCDGIVLCPGWEQSSGTLVELRLAVEMGALVYLATPTDGCRYIVKTADGLELLASVDKACDAASMNCEKGSKRCADCETMACGGLTEEETARALGMSERAVRLIVAQALVRMRKELGNGSA